MSILSEFNPRCSASQPWIFKKISFFFSFCSVTKLQSFFFLKEKREKIYFIIQELFMYLKIFFSFQKFITFIKHYSSEALDYD